MEGGVEEYRVFLDQELTNAAKIKSITKNEMRGDYNDIAMLHLTKPAKNKKNGKTIRVKGRYPTRVYDDKILEYYQPRCLILDPVNGKDTEVDVLPNSKCSRYLDRSIKDEQICVHRNKGQRKKCPIGLGNPIVCRINNGQWVQIAIHIDGSDCSSNTMVATRVSKYRSWMRNHGQENSISDKENNNSGKGENQTEGSNGVTDTGDSAEPGNSGTESTEPTQRTCNVSEFRCSDGTCIPRNAVCDGKNDCLCGLDDESSCGCTLAGTEFVTGFLNNVGPEVSILYVSAPEVTSVTVSIPLLSYEETKLVQGAEKWSIEDTTLIIAERTANKGVHITSDKPITVVAANSREFSYSTIDGTIVYPVSCLSTDYLVEVQSHRFHKTSQYTIIGTQSTATDVTIVNKKGKVFNVQLGFLDTYFVQEKDLRGTSITATNNIVVISGSECGYVPSTMTASCDHLVNQIPPRSTFGNVYIVSQQKPRTGFSFRVKVTEDNTTVVLRQMNGDLVEKTTLDIATEYVKTYLDSQPLSIKANKGVMVTQYALDAQIDGVGQGDPSMIVLPALNAFDTFYEFVIPDHFLRIGLTIYISACHDASGLLLNGKEVSTCGMSLVSIPGYGDYNVITMDLDSKWETYSQAMLSHTQRDVPFGAIMYGTRVEGAFAWRIGGKL
ncbi:uncharacterized protein LOC123554819 [Mercenaria mercenaria]|uniref:uncharacterized protein LOC123554819 n=1 Tax=Mercenaria mercenaria TaxID=6596 RepID=UPI00234E880F|nr:uncharacterized protein LOC123554819 [Mercenaria mercenaria]